MVILTCLLCLKHKFHLGNLHESPMKLTHRHHNKYSILKPHIQTKSPKCVSCCLAPVQRLHARSFTVVLVDANVYLRQTVLTPFVMFANVQWIEKWGLLVPTNHHGLQASYFRSPEYWWFCVGPRAWLFLVLVWRRHCLQKLLFISVWLDINNIFIVVGLTLN